MNDIKEKEPAPSANDASSKTNTSVNNDTTEKEKCQDVLTKYIKCSDAIVLAHSDVNKQGANT